MHTTATRKCAAWIGCNNLDVPVAQLSFRGFCPDCERVARGGQLLCHVCDEPITDNQDVVYAADEYTAAHTDRHHLERAEFADDDDPSLDDHGAPDSEGFGYD